MVLPEGKGDVFNFKATAPTFFLSTDICCTSLCEHQPAAKESSQQLAIDRAVGRRAVLPPDLIPG